MGLIRYYFNKVVILLLFLTLLLIGCKNTTQSSLTETSLVIDKSSKNSYTDNQELVIKDICISIYSDSVAHKHRQQPVEMGYLGDLENSEEVLQKYVDFTKTAGDKHMLVFDNIKRMEFLSYNYVKEEDGKEKDVFHYYVFITDKNDKTYLKRIPLDRQNKNNYSFYPYSEENLRKVFDEVGNTDWKAIDY